MRYQTKDARAVQDTVREFRDANDVHQAAKARRAAHREAEARRRALIEERDDYDMAA